MVYQIIILKGKLGPIAKSDFILICVTLDRNKQIASDHKSQPASFDFNQSYLATLIIGKWWIESKNVLTTIPSSRPCPYAH